MRATAKLAPAVAWAAELGERRHTDVGIGEGWDMRIRAIAGMAALGACALALAGCGDAAKSASPPATASIPPSAPTGDAAIIASALDAAPPAIGMDAAVALMNPNGSIRIVRRGSNGFTCVPDDPSTPGPDPMCADVNAMAWLMALEAHQPPPQGKTGLIYMLKGGVDASNTDPYASKPPIGLDWVRTGPHVMVVGDPSILDGYPGGPKPDTSRPYVMYAGTPYAHLMAPVG